MMHLTFYRNMLQVIEIASHQQQHMSDTDTVDVCQTQNQQIQISVMRG